MSRTSLLLCHVVLASVMGAIGTAAAVPQQSHSCASEVDADARLACYDKAFPPVEGAQSGVSSLEERRKEAIEDFGFNKQQRVDRDPELQAIEPDRIQATVEGVLERPSGERVITLVNGQVWLLTEGGSRGRLKADDQVTIRNAALGSFMMVTPSGIALRARRLN
ncbi:hypothetical protein [Variovorax beijingensis]|jgi:hypothetical protein|uniref:hypothetical protein n=1 Tax=Variovorax beijingensis TaxID=2496117 RepID=UPI003F69CDB3